MPRHYAGAAMPAGNAQPQGRRRFVYKSKKQLAKMSKEQLKTEVERVNFTVSRRGCTISTLYYALREMVANVPIQIAYNAVPDDQREAEIQRIDRELEQARVVLRTQHNLREQNAPAVAGSASSDEEEAKRRKMSCQMCYEDYDDTMHRPAATLCGHLGCLDCFNKFMRAPGIPKCPHCRTNITRLVPLYFP
jgi:hypothetical protein